MLYVQKKKTLLATSTLFQVPVQVPVLGVQVPVTVPSTTKLILGASVTWHRYRCHTWLVCWSGAWAVNWWYRLAKIAANTPANSAITTKRVTTARRSHISLGFHNGKCSHLRVFPYKVGKGHAGRLHNAYAVCTNIVLPSWFSIWPWMTLNWNSQLIVLGRGELS